MSVGESMGELSAKRLCRNHLSRWAPAPMDEQVQAKSEGDMMVSTEPIRKETRATLGNFVAFLKTPKDFDYQSIQTKKPLPFCGGV